MGQPTEELPEEEHPEEEVVKWDKDASGKPREPSYPSRIQASFTLKKDGGWLVTVNS